MSYHDRQDSKKKPGKKPPKKITDTYLHNAGLYYLQRFSASSESFRRVMMRKVERSCRAHPEQDRADCARMVDELVRKFLGAGLLDDRQYAGAMVSTLRRRGFSSRAIQSRLAARGLDAADVRAALGEGDEGGGDLRAAVRLARRKRLGPFGVKAPDSEKDMATFARAGFGYAVARRVLEMGAEEAEGILQEKG